MELRNYLRIAAAYRRPLLLIPLIAALVAFGATYAVAQRFVGVAVVQLIPDQVEPRTVTLRAEDGPGSLAIGLKDPTELLSQGVIESLDSHEVAQQVASSLNLAQLPPLVGFAALKAQVRGVLDDGWAVLRFGYVAKKPRDEATVDRVGQALKAELVRGSYYMEISAAWNDPTIAATMANAAVVAVRDHARTIAATSAHDQVAFFERQRATARQQVEAARAAVLQYSTSNTAVAGDSLRTAVIALEQGRTDLRQNELGLIEARQRLAVARQQLEATSLQVVSESSVTGTAPSISAITRASSPNLVYQSTQERVNILAQEVTALKARQNNVADEVTAQTELALADARQRLATAQQQLAQPGLSKLVRDQLNAQAFTLQQEVAALEGRRDAAQANQNTQQATALDAAQQQLEAARQQLAATNPTVETVQRTSSSAPTQNGQEKASMPNPVYQSLQRDLQTQEQAIAALEPANATLAQALRDREQELRDRSASDSKLAALNQDLALANTAYSQRTADWYNATLDEARPVSPIRLINPAAVPVYPVAPIKIYWVLIGLLAGLAAAVVLIFTRHAIDLSIHSARQAELELGMPLLAVVPIPARQQALLLQDARAKREVQP